MLKEPDKWTMHQIMLVVLRHLASTMTQEAAQLFINELQHHVEGQLAISTPMNTELWRLRSDQRNLEKYIAQIQCDPRRGGSNEERNAQKQLTDIKQKISEAKKYKIYKIRHKVSYPNDRGKNDQRPDQLTATFRKSYNLQWCRVISKYGATQHMANMAAQYMAKMPTNATGHSIRVGLVDPRGL